MSSGVQRPMYRCIQTCFIVKPNISTPLRDQLPEEQNLRSQGDLKQTAVQILRTTPAYKDFKSWGGARESKEHVTPKPELPDSGVYAV